MYNLFHAGLMQSHSILPTGSLSHMAEPLWWYFHSILPQSDSILLELLTYLRTITFFQFSPNFMEFLQSCTVLRLWHNFSLIFSISPALVNSCLSFHISPVLKYTLKVFFSKFYIYHSHVHKMARTRLDVFWLIWLPDDPMIFSRKN